MPVDAKCVKLETNKNNIILNAILENHLFHNIIFLIYSFVLLD